MKAALIITIALCCASSQAGTVNPALFKDQVCGTYSFIHINGVVTSRDRARQNMNLLAAAYGNSHNEHEVRFGQAYNPSVNLMMDVYEAYKQVIAEFPGVTYEEWVNAVFKNIFSSDFPASLTATVMNRMRAILDLRRPDNFYDPELIPMASAVQQLGFHTPNNRIVIVGHSQGTIYANILARYLTSGLLSFRMQPKQIGLVSIAAFVARLEGTGSTHITNRYDRPINTGRKLYPDQLAYNVTLAETEPYLYAWRGHSLPDIYLKQTIGKNAIVAGMKKVFTALRPTGPFNFVSGSLAPYYGVSSAAYSRACSVAAPCWLHDYALGYARWWTVPVLFWNEPNVDHQWIAAGSPDSRDSKAYHTALACDALWLAAYRNNRLNAPGTAIPRIPGCEAASAYYAPTQAGQAWSNYSADDTDDVLEPWPYSADPGRRARIIPVCKTEI